MEGKIVVSGAKWFRVLRSSRQRARRGEKLSVAKSLGGNPRDFSIFEKGRPNRHPNKTRPLHSKLDRQ